MQKIIDSCVICVKSPVHDCPEIMSFLGLPEPFRVLECLGCGLRWLSPQPSEEDYQKLYQKEYYQEECLGKGTYLDYSQGRRAYFRKRILQLKKFLPRNPKVLDIGAGVGDFVVEAKAAGWETCGLEFSQWACQKAKEFYGLDMISKDIKSMEGERWDMIHMNHVFEHITDPVEFLRTLKPFVNPGGFIFIEIPNQFSDLVERFWIHIQKKKLPFNLLSLHHPFFYREKAVRKLFESEGYRLSWLRKMDWRPFLFRDNFPVNYAKTSIFLLQSCLGFPNILQFMARPK